MAFLCACQGQFLGWLTSTFTSSFFPADWIFPDCCAQRLQIWHYLRGPIKIWSKQWMLQWILHSNCCVCSTILNINNYFYIYSEISPIAISMVYFQPNNCRNWEKNLLLLYTIHHTPYFSFRSLFSRCFSTKQNSLATTGDCKNIFTFLQCVYFLLGFQRIPVKITSCQG